MASRSKKGSNQSRHFLQFGCVLLRNRGFKTSIGLSW